VKIDAYAAAVLLFNLAWGNEKARLKDKINKEKWNAKGERKGEREYA